MYVIMYHYVRMIVHGKYSRIKGLELEYFKKQIQFLEENRFDFATVEDLKEGKNLHDKSVVLTFDDGYADHYENVFPILKDKGIQGFFSMPGKIIREKKVLDVNKIHFILASEKVEIIKAKLFKKLDYYRGREYDFATNEELYAEYAKENRFDDKDTIFIKRILQVVLPESLRNMITNELFEEIVADNESEFADELYMNMNQVKEMKDNGMIFGIHGYDHYWMNHLKKGELQQDVKSALEVFDGIVNPKDWICCYPYGSYSDEVIDVIKTMGATSGLGTDVAIYVPGINDIYKIPRLDTNDFPPKSEKYLEIKRVSN